MFKLYTHNNIGSHSTYICPGSLIFYHSFYIISSLIPLTNDYTLIFAVNGKAKLDDGNLQNPVDECLRAAYVHSDNIKKSITLYITISIDVSLCSEHVIDI